MCLVLCLCNCIVIIKLLYTLWPILSIRTHQTYQNGVPLYSQWNPLWQHSQWNPLWQHSHPTFAVPCSWLISSPRPWTRINFIFYLASWAFRTFMLHLKVRVLEASYWPYILMIRPIDQCRLDVLRIRSLNDLATCLISWRPDNLYRPVWHLDDLSTCHCLRLNLCVNIFSLLFFVLCSIGKLVCIK